MTQAVFSTPEALEVIHGLEAEHGPLMFFQSGGCCDGSSPMCFPAGELLLGPNDLLLGEVDGCPFYIDSDQYERWNRPVFVLDVSPGSAAGMSIEGEHGLRFVLAAPDTPSCPTAETSP